ncbi:MAG: hypothetical protein ACLSBB_14425 [Ruthenibacterium lactatiformans]
MTLASKLGVLFLAPRKGLMGISVAYQEAKTMQEQRKFGVTLARPSAQYYYRWTETNSSAPCAGNAKLTQAILRQLYEENAALHLSHAHQRGNAAVRNDAPHHIPAKLPAETFGD